MRREKVPDLQILFARVMDVVKSEDCAHGSGGLALAPAAGVFEPVLRPRVGPLSHPVRSEVRRTGKTASAIEDPSTPAASAQRPKAR